MCRLPVLVFRKAMPFALALLTVTGGALCAQEYSFRSLGTAEGLNNLAILRIYQDRAGFIWVSTEDGIFRYDGDRFEAFAREQGIPSKSLRSSHRPRSGVSGWVSIAAAVGL